MINYFYQTGRDCHSSVFWSKDTFKTQAYFKATPWRRTKQIDNVWWVHGLQKHVYTRDSLRLTTHEVVSPKLYEKLLLSVLSELVRWREEPPKNLEQDPHKNVKQLCPLYSTHIRLTNTLMSPRSTSHWLSPMSSCQTSDINDHILQHIPLLDHILRRVKWRRRPGLQPGR